MTAVAEPLAGLPRRGAAAQSRSLLGLGAITALLLLVRWLFRAQLLNGWDAVNYALALRRFDPSIAQPQLPGYPLYVAAGSAANALVRDPAAAYDALSVFGSIAAVGTLWLLARRLLGGRLALVAAACLTVSPLFWYWGEVQSPYTFLSLGSTLVAYCCLRALDGDARWLWLAAAILGISGGIRPDLILFLVPLLISTAVEARLTLRAALIAAALLALAVLVWLAPLMAVSGGPAAYLQLTHEQSSTALDMSGRSAVAGVASALRVLERYVAWALWGLGLSAGGLVVAWRTALLRGQLGGFFAAWLVPAGLFYLAVHLGQSGYLLFLLPGLLILALAGLAHLWTQWRLPARAEQACWAALLAVNVALFLAPSDLASSLSGGGVEQSLDNQVFSLTASSLSDHDAWLRDIPATIRAGGAPASTVLVITDTNLLRYPQYYLPNYRQYLVFPSSRRHNDVEYYEQGQLRVLSQDTVTLPAGVTTIVWIGPLTTSFQGTNVRRLPASGAQVYTVSRFTQLGVGTFHLLPAGGS